MMMRKLWWFFAAGVMVVGLHPFVDAAGAADREIPVKIDRFEEIPEEGKRAKPYTLFLKAGYQYDDNVRLEPLDDDIFADDDDTLFEGFFHGKYNFVQGDRFVSGIGYSHYQTLHDDLDEFDITGGIGRVYLKYRPRPLTFGLTYLPAYFWVNANSYLMRHQVRPALTWHITSDVYTSIGYSYYHDDYRQLSDEGRNGDTHEPFLNLGANLFQKSIFLSAGVAYTDRSADASDQSYDQAAAKVGLYFDLPLGMKSSLNGKYHHRTYGAGPDGVEREDDKYIGGASVSAELYYDWLLLIAEYEYTKNHSSVATYDYERNRVVLSLALKH